jgi:uncharacterized LabA/DUF88 family protein
VGKNVAVFVDVANIFYAAKAAGTDIDYVTLLKAATAGRDFVRAYAYTGLDPENENQRNFHAFLARNHYKVVSKDIRKYGDGKVKANLDIELVVDMMKTARNLDVAIVVSGDGDFAPAIRAVQEMGVRVEVISFRGNTSSDLIEVADLFTDITQLAKVDKSSSRSGRRVAGDEEDLSMTEVPDKQTEGTGQRGRGRGRGRGRAGEAEPVAASGTRRTSSRGRSATPADAASDAVVAGNGTMTVLPGEKLSRVAASPASAPARGETDDEERTPFDAEPEAHEAGGSDADEGEGDGRRRRRRRGGRGRGRGRGRDGEVLPLEPAAASSTPFDDEDEAEEPEPAPRGPRTTPFGSVWDSQLGTPAARGPVAPIGADEDFDEPEIPEYLIAEQRRGRAGAGQGGRGGGGNRGGRRGAYNAAIERERYGRGGGGGINRYPDVSGRTGGGGGGRGGRSEGGYGRGDFGRDRDRYERPAPRSGGDPWSEVPPELEEMLRAQLAQSPKARRPEPARPSTPIESADAVGELETMTVEGVDASTEAAIAEPAAPKRRAPARRRTSTGAAAAEAVASGSTETSADGAPKRRTTRKKADADPGPDATSGSAEDASAAPAKPRATRSRKTTATAEADAASTTDEAAAPKRRTTRKKPDPA